MAKTDIVAALAAPLARDVGAEVYDVTMNGDKLVVSVTRDGGVDLETLTDISRALGERLDADDVIHGSYTLEVSSPGLERTLRTPAHFADAIGEDVTIRCRPGTEGDRRTRGVITAADDATATVAIVDEESGEAQGETRVVRLDDIERARTVFTWGGQDKPKAGKSAKTGPGKSGTAGKPGTAGDASTAGQPDASGKPGTSPTTSQGTTSTDDPDDQKATPT